MSHVARHAVVRGRVQMVGFRDWTCAEADRLGVSGWVRNMADGSVELLAVGPEDRVRALLAACAEGPPAAAVSGVEDRPWPHDPRMPDGGPLSGFLRTN